MKARTASVTAEHAATSPRATAGQDGDFAPTPAAARAGLAAVRPADYARSRNHLFGAVTRLSPYITHGFLTLSEVVDALRREHGLPLSHKLVQELGWRAFFQHAWRHDGGGILQSLHAGPLPELAYARTLPGDVCHGATGVPAIDQAVRTLYTTGYLHNHARLWLASYLVHGRKVHWRTGADWMFAHLLDGDIGSNHLSWQWVAGTGSAKPYLFNADNVAQFAPPNWHSFGTAIDIHYDALEQLAHSPLALPPEPGPHPAIDAPPLHAAPPEGGFAAPDPAIVAGQDVWLVHPWSLADPPAGWLPVAVLDADWHARWPWSARRWTFVVARLRDIARGCWHAPATDLAAALQGARRVGGVHSPHLDAPAFAALQLPQSPAPWREPAARSRSFSAYWGWVRAHAPRLDGPTATQGDLFSD
jgi:deoxyribodipyrimidine photo-lyase